MRQNKTHAIGIDLLGSDNKPIDLLIAAFDLIKGLKTNLKFVFLGTKDLEEEFINQQKFLKDSSIKAEFVIAKDVINMDETPFTALRRKKESSMIKGMQLLKEKKIEAFVSCGNTAVLMTSAKMYLDLLPTISRAALLTLIPTKKNLCATLDVGANIANSAKHLVQFAKMGAAFQKNRNIIPKVGLLNIASEEKKGTAEIQKAHIELQSIANECNFSFSGNIEAKEVFEGVVDVLVTDGFTGNVFLKTAEGIASFILDKIYDKSDKQELLDSLKEHLHYAKYPGALLIGFEKIVIKCHSYSTPEAFKSGIKGAIDFCENDIIAAIKSTLL